MPRKFITAYFDAIVGENAKWAIGNPEIEGMFAEDAKMLTQDKQDLRGRAAIMRQLEKGVGMLIKIGGKSAEAPEVTLDGPERTPENVHVMKCSIKRGVRTTVFTMEFHIAEGKIRYLKNSRS